MPLPPVPSTPPAILALDTSSERLAVGLQAAGRCWSVVAEGGAQASTQLLPQVRGLLARAGVSYADLDFIAFGRGPGAFTGLRTACAVAQGIAFGLDKPVLALDSLLIVAEDARMQAFANAAGLDIGVAMDARMGEVYAGCYRHQDGLWRVLQAPALHSLASLADAWGQASLQAVAGSALDAFGDRLTLPATALRLPKEQDRASALLRLALQAAQAGAGIDAALALPLYLRDKVAQTTREREALRVAAALAP